MIEDVLGPPQDDLFPCPGRDIFADGIQHAVQKEAVPLDVSRNCAAHGLHSLRQPQVAHLICQQVGDHLQISVIHIPRNVDHHLLHHARAEHKQHDGLLVRNTDDLDPLELNFGKLRRQH